MAKKEKSIEYKILKNFEELRKGQIKTQEDLMNYLSGLSCADYDRIASFAGQPLASSYPGAREPDENKILDHYIHSLRTLGIINIL